MESFDKKLDVENNEILKKRILLAEDSSFVRLLLAKMLVANGYIVDEVEDGQLLLDTLLKKGEKYNLVISDNNMPKMDGLDVLEIIRADARFDDLPVIIHSTVADEMAEKIKSLNAVGISKENTSTDLLRKVDEILKTERE